MTGQNHYLPPVATVTLTYCQGCSVNVSDAAGNAIPDADLSPWGDDWRIGAEDEERHAAHGPHCYDEGCKVCVTASRERSRAWHAHLDEVERCQVRRHISAREFDSVHLGTGMEG